MRSEKEIRSCLTALANILQQEVSQEIHILLIGGAYMMITGEETFQRKTRSSGDRAATFDGSKRLLLEIDSLPIHF